MPATLGSEVRDRHVLELVSQPDNLTEQWASDSVLDPVSKGKTEQ